VDIAHTIMRHMNRVKAGESMANLQAALVQRVLEKPAKSVEEPHAGSIASADAAVGSPPLCDLALGDVDDSEDDYFPLASWIAPGDDFAEHVLNVGTSLADAEFVLGNYEDGTLGQVDTDFLSYTGGLDGCSCGDALEVGVSCDIAATVEKLCAFRDVYWVVAEMTEEWGESELKSFVDCGVIQECSEFVDFPVEVISDALVGIYEKHEDVAARHRKRVDIPKELAIEPGTGKRSKTIGKKQKAVTFAHRPKQ